ncbi:MAG: hypothetical protein JO291_13590, partial [Acidimicrobiia bacterium]|nr:hypothetical protein [Acidimicrobiia bacterium]
GLLGSELTISSTPADQVGPSVAAGANGQFLVVWEDFRNLKTDVDIYGQRVTKAGALLDGSGRRLSNDSTSSSSDDSRPDVAWNGSTYLTVFRSQDTGESISGRAIRPDGTVAFSGDIVSSPDSDLELSWPVIASNGSDFLIAFNLRYPGTDHGTDVWSARITDFDADATVAPIVQADGEQLYPAITFNGNYLVAWEEGDDIWAGRLRPNGTVLDGAVITGPKTADASVALAPGGSKANQFAYSWSATPPNGLSGVGALGVQFAPK